jgi:hypothetical protein
MALSKNPFRELELTFGCGPFVLSAMLLMARTIGISVRSGNEMPDVIGTRG